MAKNSGFKPGQPAPASGQYQQVGPRGGAGKEVTVPKGRPLPRRRRAAARTSSSIGRRTNPARAELPGSLNRDSLDGIERNCIILGGRACGCSPAGTEKRADKGIDGRLYFHDGAGDFSNKSDANSDNPKLLDLPKRARVEMREVLISVKGGHVTVNQIRDLRGTIERDGAAIGAFLCIEPPTKPMAKEAADAGLYTSPAGTRHPRIKILTVEEMLAGKKMTCLCETN